MLKGGSDLLVALDVWEPEPLIDLELLEYVLMTSPYIAGYSHGWEALVFDSERLKLSQHDRSTLTALGFNLG